MNRCFGFCCAIFLAAGSLAPACRAGDVADYLSREGTLKEPVTLRRDTSGLAGPDSPKGEVWTIEVTGEWTSQVAGAKGKLTAKQLAALAQHLATQDFKSLPRVQGYVLPGIDEMHQRVLIGFGKQWAGFNLKVGTTPLDYLPEPGDPRASAWSRFTALELVLSDMLQASGTGRGGDK
jgi:hypothetical protein